MISPDHFVGAYYAEFTCGSHGNHYCNRIAAAVHAGQRFDLDLECYAYHFIPGTDPQNGWVLCLYESAGAWTSAKLRFGHEVKAVKLCDMLEAEQGDADCEKMVFRSFEIKTINVCY